ncbi:homeodomain-interacting protein kinase 4-like [Heptranchias perlo]|uniref:homeodomain-interacting protein kinase 4-like n=1 Tax=Heptranchias perlo TaxID=212740 RepID=UPI00355960B8
MTNENTCYSERSLHGLNINVKKGKRVKEDLCMVGKDYESGQVQQTCIITSTQRSTDNEGGPIIDDQRENIQNMNTERFIGYPISQNIIYSPKTILQEASHKRTPAILSHNDTYNIIQLIGEGVYGKVTWCRKRSTGQFVAIKTLKYDGCVATEIRMLKLLQNVDTDNFHIVQLLECFHRNARSYLVFELLEQNLLDFQKANNFAPLPAKHIRTIATQLLRALEKLKELSIIHTDIKPDNIMLVEHMQFPFRVKVIDFGSASILPEVQHIRDPYIQARYYRSPEILLGLPFCEKLDMWSLGCVLAELRLGSPLYPGKNQYDQIRIIVETQGLPKDDLLNQASKAHLFFKRNSNPYSTRQWQLKSLPEYQSKKLPQPLEPRRRTLKSLDQLEPFSIIETLFPNDEDIAEFHDRNSMIALLKRMLNFDPKNRISPRTALRHSFITMGQLKKNYMHTKYYELSVQGLDAALNYGRVERDKHNCHLLKESQYYDANTMHRESMQDQPNHNIAFVQTAVRKRDDFTIGNPKANNQSILEDRGEQESEEADLINIRLKQIVKRHKLGSETEMNSSRMQVNEAKDSEEEESADKDSHKIFQRAKFQRRSKKIQKKKNCITGDSELAAHLHLSTMEIKIRKDVKQAADTLSPVLHCHTVKIYLLVFIDIVINTKALDVQVSLMTITNNSEG